MLLRRGEFSPKLTVGIERPASQKFQYYYCCRLCSQPPAPVTCLNRVEGSAQDYPLRGVERLFKHGASFMPRNIQIKFGSGSASVIWLICNFPLLITQAQTKKKQPTNQKIRPNPTKTKNKNPKHPHVFRK